MSAHRPGKFGFKGGANTKRSRRKGGARGPKGQPGFRLMAPPEEGWYDPNSGRTFDKK